MEDYSSKNLATQLLLKLHLHGRQHTLAVWSLGSQREGSGCRRDQRSLLERNDQPGERGRIASVSNRLRSWGKNGCG